MRILSSKQAYLFADPAGTWAGSRHCSEAEVADVEAPENKRNELDGP